MPVTELPAADQSGEAQRPRFSETTLRRHQVVNSCVIGYSSALESGILSNDSTSDRQNSVAISNAAF